MDEEIAFSGEKCNLFLPSSTLACLTFREMSKDNHLFGEASMHKLGLMALAILAGCGGAGGGQVDPAIQDACLLWANGVCRLAYLCVDTASRDAAFFARFGPDSDNCFQGLLERCISNQPAANAFGPSCGPGKSVDQTALQTCDDNLVSLSCVDWATAPSGGCENICAGTGKDAGFGSTMTLAQFCSAFGSLGCDRHFECDPIGSASAHGDLPTCKSQLASQCTGGTSLCSAGFDGTYAAACLAEYKTAACTIAMAGASQIPSCNSTCKL